MTVMAQALDIDGNEVNPGDTVTDFRGDTAIFLGVTKLPNGQSTGRVHVNVAPDSEYPDNREFYPSVYNLTIVID